MARSGVAAAIGPGRARTNPIHERDVAQVCVGAIDGDERELLAGGPEVFTRRQVIELAFDALNKPSRIVPVPLAAARVVSRAIRPIDVRLFDFLDFAQMASSHDAVTEIRGERRLRDYFSSLAGAMGRP